MLRGPARLAILQEQWAECNGHWTESTFYKQLKQETRMRRKGCRKWLTHAELKLKYGDADVAQKIVDQKELEDPEATGEQVRAHPDCAAVPCPLLCIYKLACKVKQYRVWDEDSEETTEDTTATATSFFEAIDQSMKRGSKHSTKDNKKKSKKRRRSTTSSCSRSGSQSSTSEAGRKLDMSLAGPPRRGPEAKEEAHVQGCWQGRVSILRQVKGVSRYLKTKLQPAPFHMDLGRTSRQRKILRRVRKARRSHLRALSLRHLRQARRILRTQRNVPSEKRMPRKRSEQMKPRRRGRGRPRRLRLKERRKQRKRRLARNRKQTERRLKRIR